MGQTLPQAKNKGMVKKTLSEIVIKTGIVIHENILKNL